MKAKIKELEKQAYKMGIEAFKNGFCGAPMGDKQFMDFVYSNLDKGDRHKIFVAMCKNYIKAWTAENLR